MGDYFRHWLKMGKRIKENPRIFHVNWFRKDEQGKLLWPGYGENMRILKWIVDRCRPGARATETSIGWMPSYDDIDWRGLDYPREKWDRVMAIDREAWKLQTLGHEELFLKLSEHLPKELLFERELLIGRL
jgi:phosphoenolpyruvate carboxykinase (GTP)